MTVAKFQCEMKLKLLVIGDSCKQFLNIHCTLYSPNNHELVAGKTCLLGTYSSGHYVPTEVKTIGLHLLIKTVIVNSMKVQLQV